MEGGRGRGRGRRTTKGEEKDSGQRIRIWRLETGWLKGRRIGGPD